jgi:SAM-dependent MidA family methyltransferase
MTELSRRLESRILKEGPISFVAFTKAALYDEEGGYYSRPREIGRSGDFYTSVSVGPLFGELLAHRFARWIKELPGPEEGFQLVEAGAHDGRLAHDILDAIRRVGPTLFDKIEYWIVEPSSFRMRVQQEVLRGFSNVRWFATMAELKGMVRGIIFSNELLDAMPVHVFRWHKCTHEWAEMGVGISSGTFTWNVLPTSVASPPALPCELLDVLPDGFQVECSPERGQWWRDAAASLVAGKLLAIDYGGTTEELLAPSRSAGTLRAYFRHRLTADILANPGDQDITSHVDFSELQKIGAAEGLGTEIFESQSQFLGNISRELVRCGVWQPVWSRQFQTLTHPEHLGRSFRVLVQSR